MIVVMFNDIPIGYVTSMTKFNEFRKKQEALMTEAVRIENEFAAKNPMPTNLDFPDDDWMSTKHHRARANWYAELEKLLPMYYFPTELWPRELEEL